MATKLPLSDAQIGEAVRVLLGMNGNVELWVPGFNAFTKAMVGWAIGPDALHWTWKRKRADTLDDALRAAYREVTGMEIDDD